MKPGKLLFAAVTATVLLSALVASAAARNLELTAIEKEAVWARMNFTSGFGTIECEVVFELSFHSKTLRKVNGALLGRITEASVRRCSRGGATVNGGSLPWHDRYAGFNGTLPNVTSVRKLVGEGEWRFREPTFGTTCTVRREESSIVISYAVSGGTIINSSVSGSNRCGGVAVEFSGTTTQITNGAGARISIDLI
jgi:hypothetical protein